MAAAVSAGDVIRKFLANNGVVTTASRQPFQEEANLRAAGQLFGCVTGEMPDGDDVSDNFVAVRDTGSLYDGRVMRGGQVRHPTVQLLIRSTDYPTGAAKGKEIEALFNRVGRRHEEDGLGWVLIDGHNLKAVTVQTSTTYVGREEKNRRELFSLNARMTLSPVEEG